MWSTTPKRNFPPPWKVPKLYSTKCSGCMVSKRTCVEHSAITSVSMSALHQAITPNPVGKWRGSTSVTSGRIATGSSIIGVSLFNGQSMLRFTHTLVCRHNAVSVFTCSLGSVNPLTFCQQMDTVEPSCLGEHTHASSMGDTSTTHQSQAL